MTWMERISVGTDIVVGVCAFFTLIVAAVGLRTWKNELKGRDDYEVAKSLILAAIRLENSVQVARRPVMDLLLYRPGPHLGNLLQYGPAGHQVSVEQAILEIPKVEEKLKDFQAAALDAQALWHQEMAPETESIERLVDRLFLAIRYRKEALSTTAEPNVRNMYEDQVMRSEVFSISEKDESDVFDSKFGAAVQALRVKLNPKMQRRSRGASNDLG